MYDPKIGRWLEEDPPGFDAGDGNLYRYVGNNATNATDPSGLAEPEHLKRVNEAYFQGWLDSLWGTAKRTAPPLMIYYARETMEESMNAGAQLGTALKQDPGGTLKGVGVSLLKTGPIYQIASIPGDIKAIFSPESEEEKARIIQEMHQKGSLHADEAVFLASFGMDRSAGFFRLARTETGGATASRLAATTGRIGADEFGGSHIVFDTWATDSFTLSSTTASGKISPPSRLLQLESLGRRSSLPSLAEQALKEDPLAGLTADQTERLGRWGWENGFGANLESIVDASAAAKGSLKPGQAGRFGDLNALRVTGDGLEPHHMPQVRLGFTSRADGGALVLSEAEHALTRTYGGRGAALARQERGLDFRTVLARDIQDVRGIAGAKYNRGLLDLIDYYSENFPELFAKPKPGGQ